MERRRITRFAAPVAFLAVITAAALLVRAGLEQGRAQHKTRPAAETTATTATVQTTPTGKRRDRVVRTYTVQTGDTLEAIAVKTGTTVARLEQLNPGIDPTALQVGEKIRVK